MDRCPICDTQEPYKTRQELYDHLVAAHKKPNKTLPNKPPYLFSRGGQQCPYCEVKLYSYRHINEHFSYEHNIHIELEELVFFEASDFSSWKAELETKHNIHFQEYTCPASRARLPPKLKKTYYRCTGVVADYHGAFSCPSSIETYVDNNVLKASFWRSHLCKEFLNLSKPQCEPKVQFNQSSDSNSETINGEKGAPLKEKLELFTKRVNQTNISNVHPLFNETLDKVLPFLNELLDHHEYVVQSIKTDGRTSFIYYPSSDEEYSESDEEEGANRRNKTPTKMLSQFNGSSKRLRKDLLKRLLPDDDNKQNTKRLKSQQHHHNNIRNNNNNNSNWCERCKELIEDEISQELFIHNGFDHVYTKVF